MLKKIVNLLKNNPMIIITYVALVLIYSVPIAVITSKINTKNVSDMIIYIFYMLLWIIILTILIIVLAPPFLNMLKEASIDGKTGFKSLLRGTRYIGKFILAALFFMVMFIPLSIMILILLAPVLAVLSSVAQNNTDMYLILSQAVYSFAMVFIMPFLMLWLPALFFENYGVIDCLKCGIKKVKGNYWELVLAAIALMAPSYILTVCQLITNNQNFAVSYTSPSFWIMLIINIIAALASLTFLFLLYAEIKKKESAA